VIRRPPVLVVAALAAMGVPALDASDLLAPVYRPRPADPIDPGALRGLLGDRVSAPGRRPRRSRGERAPDGAKRICGSKGRVHYRKRVRVNGRKVAVTRRSA